MITPNQLYNIFQKITDPIIKKPKKLEFHKIAETDSFLNHINIRLNRRIPKQTKTPEKARICNVNITIPNYLPNLKNIAEKLNYNRYYLFECKNLYNMLELPESLFRYVMFKAYKIIYPKRDIQSYTKDFMKFYEYRYIENVHRLIKREKNKLEKRNRKKRPLTPAQKISLLKINLIKSHPNITGFSIESMVNAYPNWTYQDLALQLITEKDSNTDNDQNYQLDYEQELIYETGYGAQLRTADLMNM